MAAEFYTIEIEFKILSTCQIGCGALVVHFAILFDGEVFETRVMTFFPDGGPDDGIPLSVAA
jgi:hypothetical protein